MHIDPNQNYFPDASNIGPTNKKRKSNEPEKQKISEVASKKLPANEDTIENSRLSKKYKKSSEEHGISSSPQNENLPFLGNEILTTILELSITADSEHFSSLLSLSKQFQGQEFRLYAAFYNKLDTHLTNSQAKKLLDLLDKFGSPFANLITHLDLTSIVLSEDQLKRIIENFPNLKVLDIDSSSILKSNIRDTLPLISKNCRHLESLHLNKISNLSTELVLDLANSCPELKSLSLSYCSGISENTITRLGELRLKDNSKKITSLHLKGDYGITQVALSSLSELKHLTLDSNIRVDKQDILSLIERCPKLESFGINKIFLDDDKDILIALGKNCPNLTSLEISNRHLFENGVFMAFIANCPKLQHLSFPVNNEQTLALAQHCPDLRFLNLTMCYDLTVETLSLLADKCPNLRSLSFNNCKLLTDDHIAVLAQRCRKLEVLILSGCSLLTDNTIVALSRYCPNLRTLDLRQFRFAQESISMLANGFPRLESLDLSECQDLDDESIELFAECKTLKFLETAGCSKVSSRGRLIALRKATEVYITDEDNPISHWLSILGDAFSSISDRLYRLR